MDFLNYINPEMVPSHLSLSEKSNLVFSRDEAIANSYKIPVVQFLDDDGIIKIMKRVKHLEPEVSHWFDHEDGVLVKLAGIKGVPRLYEVIQSDIMITSYIYGQGLHELRGNIKKIMLAFCDMVTVLIDIHGRGVIYGDIRPENIIFSSDRSYLIDFDFGRIVRDREYVDCCPTSAIYLTPESNLSCRAYFSSDFFQLAVVVFFLLTGEHPYIKDVSCMQTEKDIFVALRESYVNGEIIFKPLDNILACSSDILGEFKNIISTFLKIDHRSRITDESLLSSVGRLRCLALNMKFQDSAVSAYCRHKQREIVLFPARMAIPHKGHIEYISRLIDLGYHVKISLQRSYVIDDNDPLDKWVVMKIVSKALKLRGYAENLFSFILMPFFEKALHMYYHFAMMPDSKVIDTVASGNPEVFKYFPKKNIIDQQALFGEIDSEYVTRSWGYLLRGAVENDDKLKFEELYALSSDDADFGYEYIREMFFARQPVDFVRGNVYADMNACGYDSVFRIPRYSYLYDQVAIHLAALTGKDISISSVSSRYAEFTDGTTKIYCDVAKVKFTGEDLILHFAYF